MLLWPGLKGGENHKIFLSAVVGPGILSRILFNKPMDIFLLMDNALAHNTSGSGVYRLSAHKISRGSTKAVF